MFRLFNHLRTLCAKHPGCTPTLPSFTPSPGLQEAPLSRHSPPITRHCPYMDSSLRTRHNHSGNSTPIYLLPLFEEGQ